MAYPCSHLTDAARKLEALRPSGDGCVECLQTGGRWVHLRLCVECGHVGCCDQSPGRHATRHYATTQHPVILSYQPGEDWAYCYPDDVSVEQLFPEPPAQHA